MKTVLVFFDVLSNSQRRGLGHASLKLAEKLHEDGELEQVICLGLDPDVDVFGDKAHVLKRNRFLFFVFWVIGKLGRIYSGLKPRLVHEYIFDHFARSRLQGNPDTLLFVSRPLFNRTIAKASSNGMTVWVQSSVAHPLLNYGLVRNEEMRLGLVAKGPYSDMGWTTTIARAILQADRLITLAPEIGKFTYDSYCDFIDPRRLLTLRKYLSIDPNEFSAVAKTRQPKNTGDELVFFHLSHMNLIKGIPYLLEAWRRVQKKGATHCRLVLGGRIDHNVRQLINSRFSDLENVEYAGYLPDLVEYMGKVDVFISPSISDAGPATITEAMSAGVPVISSRNCGFASLITDQYDGFTYPYNDVTKLADILTWFIDNPGEILPMGKKARAKMETLSSGQYAEEICELIRDFAHTGNQEEQESDS